MACNLEIREGNFWIEVFHDGDRYYFNEAGFRTGGSGTMYPVDYFRGINQVAADIYFALTGRSRISGFSPIYGEGTPRRKRYAVYSVFAKPGVIGRIEGRKAVLRLPEVLTILSRKKEGDIIPDNGSFDQIALLVHLVYDDAAELRQSLDHIHSLLSITDTDGQPMILRMLDTGSLMMG